MQTSRTYTPSLLATLLLCAGVLLLYPYLQYYVDPDATAYLTISKRYAAGDYTKAINGYWSPWSCWLTALLIKAGIKAFPAAIAMNTIGAIGFLLISQSFFILFGIEKKMQWLLNAALVFFLSYAIYKQTFDDLWECFFLLCSLRIMLADEYKTRPGLWIANGIIGALAYFAKAYAFPFFILNNICCVFLITGMGQKRQTGQWIKLSIVPVAMMLLLSLPWICLLHDKYGIWTTSTAGPLNSSWYLVGHPYWKDGIKFLVPPAYPGSPYYWEDPYLANGITPHFWSSPKLFALQLVKCGYNLLKMVKAMNELSAFFMLTWILAIGLLVAEKFRSLFSSSKLLILSLSFVLFPLAFILVNFESRYIWYMLPLGMVWGALAISHVTIGSRLKNILTYAFAFSFIVWPVWDMKDLVRQGEEDFKNAQQLHALQIKGSFTTNVVYGPQMAGIARLAYFSGNAYYNMPVTNISKQELLAEMRRYRVKYYFYSQAAPVGTDLLFSDEAGKPFPEVSNGQLKGFKIFLVNP